MQRVARVLGRSLAADGVILSLVGPLGAGKTVFVKGLAEGLGVDPAGVASPTFAIANEYPTPSGALLRHVDLYRVENFRELDDFGFHDFLERGAVLAVEWGDRFPDALPRDRLEVRIERPQGASGVRTARAVAHGEASKRVLDAWRGGLADCERRDTG